MVYPCAWDPNAWARGEAIWASHSPGCEFCYTDEGLCPWSHQSGSQHWGLSLRNCTLGQLPKQGWQTNSTSGAVLHHRIRKRLSGGQGKDGQNLSLNQSPNIQEFWVNIGVLCQLSVDPGPKLRENENNFDSHFLAFFLHPRGTSS